MSREVRYQGAILRGDKVLLIRHREHRSGRSYWCLPGGGREEGESEEECVRREMLEETGLEVTVRRLLLEEADPDSSVYQRKRTFLCDAPIGEPAPGHEPEPDAAAAYAIAEVRWFDLTRPQAWGAEVDSDPITSRSLLRLREAISSGIKR